jgi:DnaJ-class molecular chaperone
MKDPKDDYDKSKGIVYPLRRFQPIWQLCPKCGGSGLINKHLPHNSAINTEVCPVCNGRMIISTPTE